MMWPCPFPRQQNPETHRLLRSGGCGGGGLTDLRGEWEAMGTGAPDDKRDWRVAGAVLFNVSFLRTTRRLLKY